MLKWFDGHLDLAMIAQTGRDMGATLERCGGSQLPAAITFESLARGRVMGALATVFVQRRILPEQADEDHKPVNEAWCYDDVEEAHRACLAQLAIYREWAEAGLIRVETQNSKLKTQNEALRVALLLEGAEGVRTVDDLQMFYDEGVRVVGLTWAEGSRWAGGDNTGGDITADGKRLVAAIDELNMIHDVSHLSERAFWTLLDEARGPVVASHSNCRALLPGKKHPERHLSDEQIKALAARGSLIGINLFAKFIVSGEGAGGAPARPGLGDLMKHVMRMEQLMGRRDLLALGSDLDGGFDATQTPAEITEPTHYGRLAEALSGAGWSDAEVAGFALGNWRRVLGGVGVELG